MPVVTVSRARWHQTKTAKGIFGELSKVIEEYAELVDTVAQAQPVMTLIEPSCLIGAIYGVVARRGRSVVELAPAAGGGFSARPGWCARPDFACTEELARRTVATRSPR